MADATVSVVINATDNASGVLQRVAGSVSALGSMTAGTTALTAEMNRQIAATSGAGSRTAMQVQRYAASMNATRDSIKALNAGLKDQQAVTQSGKAILEQHTKALDDKKAAVVAASQAYTQNTQAARANINTYSSALTATNDLITAKRNEIGALQSANAHLNSTSARYQQNSARIQTLKSDISALNARAANLGQVIDRNNVIINGEKTAFQGVKSEMRQAVRDHGTLQAAVDASTASEEAYRQEIQRMETEYRRTGQRMLDMGDDVRQLGAGVDAVTKPIQIAGAAAGVGLGIASKAAIDFEDNFAAVRKTVDGTPEQLDAVKQAIIDMTTTGINGHNAIPLTTAQLTELAAAGGQLGVSVENVAEFTETMAMLGTATNLSGEQGAATLARFMNVANVGQDKISNLGSAIVDLGNNFATTEAEIADMAMNMGKTGALVGISAQDILAYSTALSSMGVEAAAGGSSMQRIWMDIQAAVSAGGEDLENFAKVSKKSSKEFAEQWGKDASGAYKDFLKGLGEMTTAEQVKFLSDLGFNNVRDRDAILALSGPKGFELLTKAIKMSNEAWADNAALQHEFETKSETTASKMAVLRNNAAEAARSFGEVMLPSLVDITGGLTGAAQSMAGWSDGTKKAAVGTALFLAGTGAAAKGTASLIKGAGGVMDGIGKIRAFTAASEAGGTALAAMGSAALPVAAGVAAVAGATVIMYEAGRAYEEYRAEWSRGGYEMAESVREYVSAARELNSIQYELRQNQIIIDDPGSSAKAVETAKTRVNELKQLLAEKYGLDIDVSTGELDAAIDKLKQIDYLTAKQNIAGLLKYGNDKNGDYNKAKDDAAYYRETNDSIKAQKQATKELKGELLLLDDALDKGSLSQEEYNKRFNELIEATGNPNFKDMPTEILKNGDAIKDWGESLDETKRKNEELLAASEKTIAEYTQSMNDLANAGLAEIEFGDAEQGLEHIASAVKNADLSMNDWAVTAALAQEHIDSLETAWTRAANGDGTALNGIIKDYISNMTEFGASAQETAQGAALIANGFTTMDQAAKAGGDAVQNVMDSLKDIAEKYDLDIDINADGTVTWHSDTTEPDSYEPDDKHSDVIYGKDSSVPDSYKPEDKHATVYYGLVIEGITPSGVNKTGINWSATKKAKGDTNFRGGLAMVNDQKGIADPRELIVDGGHAFIPDGRDVVLPLSKGAKIYTAAQTKAIMAGIGIPHYAGGKDNSEGFTNARDDLSHYLNTHAVSVTEQLERWNKLLKDAAQNEKDVADAQEQIFRLQTQINKEIDEASHAYIKNRTYNNDWDAYGDDPLAAFDRFKARQNEAAAASQQTWMEADKNIRAFGEELLDGRMDQSLKWIDYEKKYNNLSLEDEMKLYQQMQEYVRKYYEQGLIDQEKAREASTAINERYLDANKELLDSQADARKAEYDRWEKDMTNWKRIHDTYDDWDEIGDSVSKMYARAIDRQQEFYDRGIIGWQEYRDRTLDYQLEMYSAASSEYDAMLRKQADAISETRERFSKEETALRDSWTVADRRTDIAEVDRLLGIYENAATDAGQQRYKELLEQKKQLEREEQVYRLQQDNNATLDALQEDYDKMEADKKRVLASLKLYNADISSTVESTRDIAEQLGIDYANAADSTLNTLSDIYGLLQNICGLVRDRNSMYNYERRSYSADKARIAGGTVNYVANGGTITYSQISSVINSAIVKGAGRF